MLAAAYGQVCTGGQVEARSCIEQEYVPDDLAADIARVAEQYASNGLPKPCTLARDRQQQIASTADHMLPPSDEDDEEGTLS